MANLVAFADGDRSFNNLRRQRHNFTPAKHDARVAVRPRPWHAFLAGQNIQDLIDNLGTDDWALQHDGKRARMALRIGVQRINSDIGISEESCGHSTLRARISLTKDRRLP